MLKLLAHENAPRLLVANLRLRGHDVRWVLEEQRGIADPQVLREALAPAALRHQTWCRIM